MYRNLETKVLLCARPGVLLLGLKYMDKADHEPQPLSLYGVDVYETIIPIIRVKIIILMPFGETMYHRADHFRYDQDPCKRGRAK